MRTLQDLLDDRLMSSPVKVYDPDGHLVAELPMGDESSLSSVLRYLGGEVLRELDADGACVAYVKAPDRPIGERSIGIGYQGRLDDEAAFSADWRSREKKASPKQLAIIRRNMEIYLAIKRDRWPEDPSQLLSYEASDALDEIFKAIGPRKR